MLKSHFFDTLLESVLVVNSDFKIIYCNEPASKLAEVSLRKIIRQQPVLSDLFQGVKLENPLSQIQEQTPYKETPLVTPSGEKYRIQWTIQPFQENEWLVFFRDVTLEEILQKKYRGELEKKEQYINELKGAKAELENYSKNLEKMVADRTAEIQSMNKTMQALLDSLHQGFFIFNAEGTILPVYSKACEALYNRGPQGVAVWDYLGMTDKETPGFKKWMSTVFAELLPFPDLAPLGPAYLPSKDGRTVKLEYYPIRAENEVIEGVVVMATDITELVDAQLEAAKEKNHAQFILKLIQSQADVLRFVNEAKNLLGEIKSFASKPFAEVDVDVFYRLLHTLKGGAASFSGEEIALHCHDAESLLTELKHNPDPNLSTRLRQEVDRISEAYNKYSRECQMILGPMAFNSERHLQVSEGDLLRMIKELKTVPESAPKVAEQLLNKYLLEPLSSFFMSYNDSLQKLAERLGKEINPIQIVNGEILVWGSYYQPIFATFVHLFRNALDHGIETPEERLLHNKPATGSMRVDFELASGHSGMELVIVVTDDGRGIDPAKIKNKLMQKGITLKSWDDQSLLETLFWEDMSLANAVTDISGRGVGLSAVKALVQEHGGRVIVSSVIDKGTRFEIRLPYVKEPAQTVAHLPPVPSKVA